MLIWGWLLNLLTWLFLKSLRTPKGPPPMPTPQDLFTAVITDDTTVITDQATLDADTSADLAAHTGLVAAVLVPTLVKKADGTLVGLIPTSPPGGPLQNIVFVDGSAIVTPPPATP